MNGVINIVTRNAQESQGALLSAGTSREEPGFGTLRYGGQLNPDLHYRIYGKYNHRDDFHFSDGSKASDNLDLGRTGFRSDWTPNAQETLTLQGDYFNGTMQQTLTGSDAVVALPGGCGTLEELFEAITLKRLALYFNPIILLNTKGFYTPLQAFMQQVIDERFLNPEHGAMWSLVDEPEDVLPRIRSTPRWHEDARSFAAVR